MGEIKFPISNRPVEALYAVDGTGDTAVMNDNVHQFEQRYLGVEPTNKFYYPGPTDQLNGSDSPNIVTNVENDIRTDYTTARYNAIGGS